MSDPHHSSPFSSYKASLFLDAEGNVLHFDAEKLPNVSSCTLAPLVRVLHKFSSDLTVDGDSITYFNHKETNLLLILLSHKFQCGSLGAVFYTESEESKKAHLLVNSLYQHSAFKE
ncbi:hypothetical protein GEMRC1_001718 [Eukaryota sp. GEM-RC1]